MRRITLLLAATGLVACGRTPGPETECENLQARSLIWASFDSGDDFSLTGGFRVSDTGYARSGYYVARLDAGDGSIRSTGELRPQGARAGVGFWLYNQAGSGTLTVNASIDGGNTWRTSTTPPPSLATPRNLWAYAEATFDVDPRASGYHFSIDVSGRGGGYVDIDDLQILDYDVCADDQAVATDEPMAFIPATPTISAFWIDRYEATVDLDLGLGNRDQSGGIDGSTTAVALVRPGVLPRNALSWYQAAAACGNAGKRLCTNLELERACAGDAGLDFPYGDTFVTGNCSFDGHVPTGSSPDCVSPFGVYDLVGNLEEWTDVVTASDSSQAFGGSFNNPGRCNALINRVGESYASYAGFRCCRD